MVRYLAIPDIVLGELTAAELRSALDAGLVRPSGRTGDGRIRSYCLTAAGRILLGNRLTAEKAQPAQQ